MIVIITKEDVDKLEPKMCWTGLSQYLESKGIDTRKLIRQGLTLDEIEPIMEDHRTKKVIEFAKIRMGIE